MQRDPLVDRITLAVRAVPGVVACSAPRVRGVGNKVFADLVIQIRRTETFPGANALTEAVEQAVRVAVPEIDVDLVLKMEPVAAPDEPLDHTIRYLARAEGLRVHDVRVLQVGTGVFEADVHVEVDPGLSLKQSHDRMAHLEASALAAIPGLRALNSHLEVFAPALESRRDTTPAHPEIVNQVRTIAEGLVVPGVCRDIRVYHRVPVRERSALGRATDDEAAHDLVLHVAFPGNLGMPMVHEQSAEIERALRAALPELKSVLIQAEPRDA